MKKNIIILFLFGLFPFLLKGQVDTVIQSSSVVIVQSKLREQAHSGMFKRWDEKKIANLNADNFSDLLSQESNIFIKSYGLNSLATSSIRGGSGGQTLVLWNGLPIQSPMLGLLDLSLLPTQSAEEVTLQKGGNSALWGSGAIGGILSLKNKKSYQKGSVYQLGTKVGAFGEWIQDGQIRLGDSKFQSSTKFVHHEAKNDFPYRVAPGFPKKKQINNQFSQQNFFQDFYYQFNQKHQLAAHFWYQQSDREIPPTTVQNNSLAHQSDQAIRFTLDWKAIGKSSILNSKLGLFKEKIDYFDDAIGLVAPSNFSTVITEVDGQLAVGQHQTFIAGSTHSFTKAQANGYANTPKEFRTALFGSYRFSKDLFVFQTSLRQTFLNTKRIPLVSNSTLTFAPKKGPILALKISKNYRLPTLNDRYWFPGGNKDLLAENGWSQELNIAYQVAKGYSIIDLSLSVFNRTINDWIMWSVQEGQNFWSANNIAEVWSRGLEPRVSINRAFKNTILKINLGYDYIRSTNQVGLLIPRIEKGAQLIYTPVHQAFGNLSFDYKKMHFSYHHHFTGKSQGINEAIDNFQTANIRLQYEFKYERTIWNLFFSINNLWDSEYFVIERRPMPGRHWQVGLKLKLNSKDGKSNFKDSH